MTDTNARPAGTKKPEGPLRRPTSGEDRSTPYERNQAMPAIIADHTHACAEALDGSPCTKPSGHDDWQATAAGDSWSTPLGAEYKLGCSDPQCDGHLKHWSDWEPRAQREHAGDRPTHSRDFGNGVRLVAPMLGEWTLERSTQVVDDTFAFATSLAAATQRLAYLALAPEWPAVPWATEHRTDDGADDALMRSFTRNLVEPQRSVQAVLLEQWMATVEWSTPERFETIAQVWLSGNDEELNFVTVQHLRESARVLEAAADEWQRLQDEQGAREGLGEPGER